MLNENKALYEQFKNTIKNIYFNVHAIYEPDASEPYPDCYLAAVDLFQSDLTFRLYFKVDDGGNVEVVHLERWFFG